MKLDASYVFDLPKKPGRPGKSQIPRPPLNLDESTVRSDLKPMLGELRALAKMVEDELGRTHHAESLLAAISTPQFERGRLYDEYSARRTERLRRKKRERGETVVAEDHRGNSDFTVEFAKRKSAKKCESAVRKSVPANFSVGRREGLRSSARLSKENMKPPPVNGVNYGDGAATAAAIDGQRRRNATRSSRNW